MIMNNHESDDGDAFIGTECLPTEQPIKSEELTNMVKRRWNHKNDFFYHPI